MREICDLGGVTIAQSLDTAGEPDMPASAIASGCIDYILAPEDIQATLRRITSARPCPAI
jgi:two-component system chemotaxis response regulator CheB